VAKGERPRDERWVAGVLRQEAERHEPDRRRVLARVWSQAEDPAGARGPGRTAPRAGRRVAGWVAPVAVAAAGVVVVAGVTLLGARPGAGPATSPTEPVQAVSDNPTPTLSQAIGTATTAPSGHPASSPAVSAPPPSGSAAPGRAGVRISISRAAAGHAVTLPESGDRDWMVAGSRSDGVTVRSKDGGQRIGGPHLTGNPAWSVVDSPFAVSWSGGMPEQDRSGVRTWLSVRGPAGGPVTGMLVSAPAGAGQGTLVLYAGATGADGHLRAAVGGAVSEADLPAGSGGAGGLVVTIRFTVPDGPATLEVDLTSGTGGAVCLAAAALG
jgi:hypothetical protein